MSPIAWTIAAAIGLILAIAAWDLRAKGTRAQQADTELAVDYMRALKDPTDWGRVRAEKDADDNREWWS